MDQGHGVLGEELVGSSTYINGTVIPLLCRKAGVPAADARGNITSHRARSTIASQLYSAKEPMTLFELQAWLGHRSPQSTTFDAQITPTTLNKAYYARWATSPPFKAVLIGPGLVSRWGKTMAWAERGAAAST